MTYWMIRQSARRHHDDRAIAVAKVAERTKSVGGLTLSTAAPLLHDYRHPRPRDLGQQRSPRPPVLRVIVITVTIVFVVLLIEEAVRKRCQTIGLVAMTQEGADVCAVVFQLDAKPVKSASTGVQRHAWLTGLTTSKNPHDTSASKK